MQHIMIIKFQMLISLSSKYVFHILCFILIIHQVYQIIILTMSAEIFLQLSEDDFIPIPGSLFIYYSLLHLRTQPRNLNFGFSNGSLSAFNLVDDLHCEDDKPLFFYSSLVKVTEFISFLKFQQIIYSSASEPP